MPLRELIIERIRTSGPLTFAAYMELALYHPEFGYYARADRRSGRAGDFFTSADLGPLFGELLADQFAEMWRLLGRPAFDLVEVGASNGWLARDILDATATADPAFYAAIRLHLVERSVTARAAHPAVLSAHTDRLTASTPQLPDAVCGAIFANELLDALPTHVVVMTRDGLREIFVDARGDRLVERDGPLSSPEIPAYFDRLGLQLQPGWRAEVNLSAVAWVGEAARRLRRGFLLMIDYGHNAHELYSAARATGTLATYRRHVIESGTGGAVNSVAPWLSDPGERDITSHVDLSSIRRAAEDEHLRLLGLLDQTYFLIGLGVTDRLAAQPGATVPELKQRLAAKTLLLPGGLGSTHKILILGKDVGTPRLRGCSYRVRAT